MVLACSREHAIGVRQEVREGVLAVRVGRNGFNGVSTGIEDRLTVSIHEGHLDSRDSGLVRVLDSIPVRVKPYVVSEGCRFHETEVDHRLGGRSWRQRDRVGNQERALASLSARRGGVVGEREGVVRQVHLSAIARREGGDDLDLVGAHRQAVKDAILAELQKQFGSDFIIAVNFSEVTVV